MLGIDSYLKVILKSPIPCMWINFDKSKNDKKYCINILGYNEKLNEMSNKKFKKDYKYKVDINEYNHLCSVIKRVDKDNKIRLVEFVEILDAFYKIDIVKIEENLYVVWFSEKIDLDKNIKTILNDIGIYVWFKDALGRYVYTNKEFQENHNYISKSIIGKTDFEIFPEESATVFVNEDKKLLFGEKKYIEYITNFEKKYFDVISHVVKNDNGDIVGTVGICINSSIKNDFINKYTFDNKILHLISDTIPDSLFFKDNKGIFRHCNKVFAENRNLKKEDIIGKTEKQINTPIHKIKKYDLESQNIIKSKKILVSNNAYVYNDGRKRYFETVKVPFVSENKDVDGVLGISRDISHRKEYELEFERLRMEFFANLSHEFKTPLNLIFSSVQLIESKMDRDENSEGYKTYTNIIKQNGYRLLKMVNNLIDSTRLSSGCLDYNPENYNIVEFIEDICDSVQHYANEEKIVLIFDTNLEEKIMEFDLEKMERIMLNLLSNAIKYNKENGKIETILNFEEDYLYIKIKDSGVGISKDKLDDVFKLFKQINNRITKLSEGSGIGLSIVKSLVELHNATITVNSEKGKGSEFIIKMPIKLSDEKICDKKTMKYNRYVKNIDIEFSDIYTSVKNR